MFLLLPLNIDFPSNNSTKKGVFYSQKKFFFFDNSIESLLISEILVKGVLFILDFNLKQWMIKRISKYVHFLFQM